MITDSLFPMYQFPSTRYQGSKYKLREWIQHSLEKLSFETVLDAFSGTCSISYTLKEMNKQVFTNDNMRFNNYIAKALVENNTEFITKEDYEEILQKKSGFKYSNFIEDTFQDIYYLDEENKWLDLVVQNIHQIKNEYKKSMFFWALFQACISKRPYNLFHRKNLYVRTSNVKRSFGNKVTWDKSFEEHFYKFIKQINDAVFDNQKGNISFCKDIFELDVIADLIYIDTPYIPQKGSITTYREFYHFLEGLTMYENWNSKIDYNSKHRRLLPKYSVWDDKKRIKFAFDTLIEKYKKSILVISYRSDGIPTIEEISEQLKKHGKKVHIETVDYQYVLSKKRNLKEVLIIAK